MKNDAADPGAVGARSARPPRAKLLLKTRMLADEGNRRRVLDALTAQGIAPDRIELQDTGTTPGWGAHMAYYDRVDIALDPVAAVGGGTTSCDALWMGVPLVTLAGDCVASRMTASMLTAVGHPEWITASEEGYIAAVTALAGDVEHRKNLRSAQRARMAASPLCNGGDLATQLENAYFEMFRRWLGDAQERHAGAP
jgi:predicted O-linked N-acetylglucosamine transferase (SPINDLY family)